jgi:hypothetical protein
VAAAVAVAVAVAQVRALAAVAVGFTVAAVLVAQVRVMEQVAVVVEAYFLELVAIMLNRMETPQVELAELAALLY